MNSIIVCEGKTDAILFGYFLIRTRGYTYSKAQLVPLPWEKSEQNLVWYVSKNESDHNIAIWSVGGITRIGSAIKNIIKRNMYERNPQNRFDKLLVIMDRDSAETETRIEQYGNVLNQSSLSFPEERSSLQAGAWYTFLYDVQSTPPQKQRIESALYLLPEDSEGNLETFLLNSIKDEGEEQDAIVTNARNFIDNVREVSFIAPNRCKEKACLGATLSVLFPEWIFFQVDEKLRNVEWENFQGTSGLREMLQTL